ncbi:MAG: MlaE family lipid ABC transporter permease subunit [Sulfuricurvum sp.]|uniref:ABC transporter permease n=1 Tax=Sulfuricurvum sp. TaxID=2025608 RepID=UPI0026294CE7|nr:MlaE family lipid ABC transporter permease subunit [Sulfuricurvum sp.]MDD2828878.1 MlaE family lipid ABC transporter permease subunit [Sulfuricurvum sp.]MDD4948541.1 MlaE family lipid ABC transporter permease subunit [Sulfuricurvum sp.]
MQKTPLPSCELHTANDHIRIVCSGEWQLHTLRPLAEILENFTPTLPLHWDITAITTIDSAGIALLQLYYREFEALGFPSKLIGANDEQLRLYHLLYPHPHADEIPPIRPTFLFRLGVESIKSLRETLNFFSFLGEAFMVLLHSLRKPWLIRYRSISSHIITSGADALPIIALSAFLIGVVIAYQSVEQLQKFGADILIVDMIGISLTRELAPLITAIVIAGRSGSAFTAQIGAMKMTQEIDAMKTMGFHPYLFLVWPRVIALMIIMPLLIFFADLVGIFGGMVVANAQAHLSYSEFIHRLQGSLPMKHFVIGIVKGPFFAMLIALVGTYRGFQVSSNTESIGQYTTKSVVNSIFLVIACDAIFSILLTELQL